MSLRSPIIPYIRCLQRQQCLYYASLRHRFHTSTARHSDSVPNHYETLDLQPTASTAEVKRQFYTLSKLHHPDLHPNDTTASARFVKISEAYHILGSPEKRARYDRDYHRAHGPSSSHHHHHPPHFRPGSHSSHSTSPAGGRPASGLSRRRTQFRGPPPSFYRSGGYGAQGAKRAANAPGGGTAGVGADVSGSGSFPGGFGPGQGEGNDPDIPHWDREGHFRTHEGIRLRKRPKAGADETLIGGGTMLFNFIVVGSVISFVLWVPTLLEGGVMGRRQKENA